MGCTCSSWLHVCLECILVLYIDYLVLSNQSYFRPPFFSTIIISRINYIITNLISYSFLPFYLLSSRIFFSLFWIGYRSALPICPQSSTRTTYLSHQQVFYLLYLLKASSSFSLFIYEHMNDIGHLGPFVHTSS
jgi:hypothetical protein